MSDLQQSIIGNLLLYQKDKQKELADRLLPVFFEGKEREILIKIKTKIKEGLKADILNTGIDKEEGLRLISTSSHIGSIESILSELKTEYELRVIKSLNTSQDKLEAVRRLTEMNANCEILQDLPIKTISEVFNESFQRQEQAQTDYNNLPKTGFVEFDQLFAGFMERDLITIGGFTGAGKSTLLFSLIKNLSFNLPTLIFNLEMSNDVMQARILSSLSGISFDLTMNLGNSTIQDKIDKFRMRDHLTKGLVLQEDLKLKMEDNTFNITSITTKIRNEAKKGLKIVFIDYVQLIKPEFPNPRARHLEVAEITKTLKLLAKELRITIIILAQLGRGTMHKEEPDLLDLKESNSIAEDSDVVMLLFRDKNNNSKLKLSKARNFGTLGIANLRYNLKTKSYE